MAKQARGEHPRVIEDENVAAPEESTQIGEHRMLDVTVLTTDDHQPGPASLRRRFLRNQLIRQVEVEGADVHFLPPYLRLRFLQRPSFVFDVVIAGGGPAGLSAALLLGRCRRRVLLCDTGRPRNLRAKAMHGYLSRDGIDPSELLRLGREELRAYGIEPRNVAVEDVTKVDGGFEVRLADGERVPALTVLLATGVNDHPPDIPGMDDCYGISVHHCPYCDGWEHRDQTIAVIGERRTAVVALALSLKTWSDRIIACTHGARVSSKHRAQLQAHGITLHTQPIARVEHDAGRITSIVFKGTGGVESVACEALFFTAPQSQQCELAERLGCEFTDKGTVRTNHLGQTCIEGVYVVGDASRDVQFVIVAAAEGAKAGVAINKALQSRAGLTPERHS